MPPRIVADIGNSRIKWGLCGPAGIIAQVSLPPYDTPSWKAQAEAWNTAGATWVVGGVQPRTLATFVTWLESRQQSVLVVNSYRMLPLQVMVDKPDGVGLDRLFNAVAAGSRKKPTQKAVIVDAGSAVTVDLVGEAGHFRGGAILPGLRLMAQTLHDHTAQLPNVPITQVNRPPGLSTVTAIEIGVAYAVLGGIERLIREMGQGAGEVVTFLTGGEGPLLAKHLTVPVTLWPEMTLEGLRLSVVS